LKRIQFSRFFIKIDFIKKPKNQRKKPELKLFFAITIVLQAELLQLQELLRLLEQQLQLELQQLEQQQELGQQQEQQQQEQLQQAEL
jgi:hypothetical protein